METEYQKPGCMAFEMYAEPVLCDSAVIFSQKNIEDLHNDEW